MLLSRRVSVVGRCVRRMTSVTDPYRDGKYEHADGSPVDITGSLAKGVFGGGDPRYASNWDKIFSNQAPSEVRPSDDVPQVGDTSDDGDATK